MESNSNSLVQVSMPLPVKEIFNIFQTTFRQAIEKAQSDFEKEAHWITKNDAVEILGWPKKTLNTGIEEGHLHPLDAENRSGGARFAKKELVLYQEYLLKHLSSGTLPPVFQKSSSSSNGSNLPVPSAS